LPNDVTPHVLRHSLASEAADLGFADSTVAQLIGHKGKGTTSRYIHGSDLLLLAAAGLFGPLACQRQPRQNSPSPSQHLETLVRSQQELERVLDQYDLDHAKRGGLAGAASKLFKEAGARGLAAFEVVNRLFPDLPSDERKALSKILDRDMAGYDGRGWLRVLVAGGDIKLLKLAKKSIWQMQGRKLLEIEGAPKLAFELRDGHYWDGVPATKNGTTTPVPDGFYVWWRSR
jgi:hypothetical protein